MPLQTEYQRLFVPHPLTSTGKINIGKTRVYVNVLWEIYKTTNLRALFSITSCWSALHCCTSSSFPEPGDRGSERKKWFHGRDRPPTIHISGQKKLHSKFCLWRCTIISARHCYALRSVSPPSPFCRQVESHQTHSSVTKRDFIPPTFLQVDPHDFSHAGFFFKRM